MPSLGDLLTSRLIAPKKGDIVPKDRHCKSLLLDSIIDEQPTFDINRMCATTTISTPTPDRSEDVVVPSGISLANYIRNPVVYFDHGFDCTIPIAKSEDPDGNNTVQLLEDRAIATSYFSPSIRESVQIFDLIVEKFVRAASIHFTPIEAEVRTNHVTSRDRPGLYIAACELLEWSWVGVPDNPEAVTKLLDRNRLAGEQIADPIRKSLQRYAAPLPYFGRGWAPGNSSPDSQTQIKNSSITTETKTVKKKFTREQILKMTAAQRKAAQPEMDEESLKALQDIEECRKADPTTDPNGADPNAPPPGTEGEVTSETETETEGDTSAEVPLGAQRLGEFYSMLCSLEQQCRTAFGPVENMDVRDSVMQMCDTLAGMCDQASQLYSASYPDQPALKSMDQAGSDTTDTVAKLLANSATQRLAIQGAMSRMKTLLGAKNLTPQQKSVVQIASSSLGRVVLQADRAAKAASQGEAKSAAGVSINEKVADEIKGLAKQFDEIGTMLKASIPQR